MGWAGFENLEVRHLTWVVARAVGAMHQCLDLFLLYGVPLLIEWQMLSELNRKLFAAV